MENQDRHNLNRSDPTNRVYFTENPWDGGGLGISRSLARPANFLGWSRSFLVITIVLTLSILFLAGTGHGQPAPKADSDQRANLTNMDKETRKLAKEYTYLLEQLIYLSSDYCRYFEKLDDKVAAENYKTLHSLCSNLSKSGYYDNLEKLVIEIDGLKGELALRKKSLSRAKNENRQHSHDIKRTQESSKVLRLTSSLLSELDALEEQLEVDIISKTEADKSVRRVIQQYVVTIMRDSIAGLARSVMLTNVPNVEVATLGKGRQTRVFVSAGGSDPVVISIPEPPDPPDVPKLKWLYDEQKGQHGQKHRSFSVGNSNNFVRTFRDSIITSSGEIEIRVINPFGKMSITGWDKDRVTATFEISIASANPEVAEEFGNKIQLRMFEDNDNIFVEAVVPNLTDPRTRISESHLNLMVPFENELKVNNSAGRISLSDLKSDIQIKSDNTSMDIFRVDGDVEIVNSSGEIELEKVSGDIIIQNRMGGPVSLQSCSGTIEIDNSHGPVQVNHSEGDLTVRNTGRVEVDNHHGSVRINNRNGLVSVNQIDGDLVVFNSFEPLKVYNVSGSVWLENANAEIEAENIDGALDISNRYGKIYASYIAGPVNIKSSNGDVFMELYNQISGKSSVVASGGRIFLELSPRIDLLLTMMSENGAIEIADFKTVVSTNKRGLQTAELKIGDASNLLAVSGNRSKIVVRESD